MIFCGCDNKANGSFNELKGVTSDTMVLDVPKMYNFTYGDIHEMVERSLGIGSLKNEFETFQLRI